MNTYNDALNTLNITGDMTIRLDAKAWNLSLLARAEGTDTWEDESEIALAQSAVDHINDCIADLRRFVPEIETVDVKLVQDSEEFDSWCDIVDGFSNCTVQVHIIGYARV